MVKMVAFSLYRGNLHDVPDVPRRWLMPTPKISLKDFRVLLDRRNRALARAQSAADTSPTTSNPISDSEADVEGEGQEEINGLPDGTDPPPPPSPLDPLQDTTSDAEKEQEEEGNSRDGGDYEEKADSEERLDGGDDPVDSGVGDDAVAIMTPDVPEYDPMDVAGGSLEENQHELLENPNEETNERVDVSIEKEYRKKEVEDRLQILNEKKHGLVQVLRQILTAEGDLKKRNNEQGAGTRQSVSLQVDVNNDSGESDGVSDQNVQSCPVLRMSSISPSDSLHRKPFFSSVRHITSQASLPVGSSPPCLAQAGNQGQAANLTVAVSGASYIASSPSPAASGGTSAFRDNGLPSPWN